jgi:hypothetical protein
LFSWWEQTPEKIAVSRTSDQEITCIETLQTDA